MKNIKWKDIYEQSNNNKYCQITKVLRKYIIKSNVKNFLKNYGKVLLVLVILLTIFLIYTLKNNLIIVLYSMILLFFMFLMAVFYSTYRISLEEDKLIANINFQDTIIPYKQLGNIYLAQEKSRILFIPIYYYSLKITYFIDEEKMNIYSFPVVMLNKKEVKSFFESFEVKAYKSQDDEIKKAEMDKKNFYKAIGIVVAILFIIAMVISIILYILH